MIVGVGNDIVEIDRINLIYKKFGEKFLNKVYTINEINFFNQNKSRLIYRLANRFAAKEAFYKALNHNKKSRIPSFKDVEIFNAKGIQAETSPIGGGCGNGIHLSALCSTAHKETKLFNFARVG